jgi:hypothetical protein
LVEILVGKNRPVANIGQTMQKLLLFFVMCRGNIGLISKTMSAGGQILVLLRSMIQRHVPTKKQGFISKTYTPSFPHMGNHFETAATK